MPLKTRTKDNLLAVAACLAVALIFAAVAWWAWWGVLAAHESASEQLERPSYHSTRTATNIYSYSLYFVAIGVLASTLALAALGVAMYVVFAMRRQARTK